MNKWMINGISIPAEPKALLYHLLTSYDDIKYWSAEALRELYTASIKTTIATAEQKRPATKGGVKAQLTRFIRSASKKLNRLPADREKMLKKIYDEILRCEGHDLLRGFGIGNQYGDKLFGDPERRSILKLVEYIPQKPKRSLIMASKKVLLKVAMELQKVLKIEDPPMDLEADEEGLTAQILEAAGLIKYEADDAGPADEISAGTLKQIKKLQEAANEDKADDTQVEDDVPPKAEPKAKAEKKAPKAEKTKAEPKAKKEKPPTTEFEHRETSQAGKIDSVVLGTKKAAMSYDAIAEKVGCMASRVKGHIKHLEKDHDVKMKESKNKKGDVVYKIVS